MMMFRLPGSSSSYVVRFCVSSVCMIFSIFMKRSVVSGNIVLTVGLDFPWWLLTEKTVIRIALSFTLGGHSSSAWTGYLINLLSVSNLFPKRISISSLI